MKMKLGDAASCIRRTTNHSCCERGTREHENESRTKHSWLWWKRKKTKHTVLLPNRFHFPFFCSNFPKLKEDCESQSLHVMSFWFSPLAAAAPPQGRPTTSNLTTTWGRLLWSSFLIFLAAHLRLIVSRTERYWFKVCENKRRGDWSEWFSRGVSGVAVKPTTGVIPLLTRVDVPVLYKRHYVFVMFLCQISAINIHFWKKKVRKSFSQFQSKKNKWFFLFIFFYP